MASTIFLEEKLSGNWTSHPEPEAISITGISGRFPDSDSVIELQENLFSKMNLISDDNRRWKRTHPEIPHHTGKINGIEKFDASFFGVHYKETHTIDPMSRLLLEKTYEAIIDAGLNPKELSNTNTGVFMGAGFSESEKTSLYDKIHVNKFGITGCSRGMLANRISQWLDLTGPSYTVDTACSSSLYALEHAYRAIREGRCNAAIVGSSNLCLHPHWSLQLNRLGVLSADGKCKTFDDTANGYVRSEAVVVCILQKAKDSRRIYAQIVHAKTNCDGYKEQGISYPSGDMQKLLLSEFYEECSIPPSTIEYVEAHGTGTKVGDPIELNVIGDIFCEGRSDPLMIGSIKSNLGHSEPTSGLCSVAKLCIAYNTGYIPPNINFNVPRKGISLLEENKVKVVTEKQPWDRGMSGIDSFGFGGANAHVLLKNIARAKLNNGLPSDDLPRLVCVSGRTEAAVARILDDLESRTIDVELVRLLHAIHDDDIGGHIYRGYTLLESTPTRSVSLARNIQYFSGVRRPVCFVYPGIGSQWEGLATQFIKLPVFAAAIEKCHRALQPMGIYLTELMMNSDPNIYDNIVNSFIGVAAVQIGLTDVLKSVGIEPDFIIGHSVGELGCAYADASLTVEQMILSAYYIGLAASDTTFIKGSMAVIELGYKDIKKNLPSEIEVACHKDEGSCTISGPADKIKTFVAELVAQGIIAKEMPWSNIACHSRHIAEAGPNLFKKLKLVIPTPKPRSKRWLSTSIQQNLWKNPKSEMCSAEYYVNNFVSPVLFEETARLIPTNAITVEICPNELLQAILYRSLNKDIVNVSLFDIKSQDYLQSLFTSLGKLYEAGLNPHLASIYPTIKFPVSQGTPMLSHLVEWEHSSNWYVSAHEDKTKMQSGETTVTASITRGASEFMAGHVIDGRNLYPVTGYILMVWETLAMMMGELATEVSVVLENVRFLRDTLIPKQGNLEFIVMIHKGSGQFEIVESGASIVTGRIYAQKNVGRGYRVLPAEPESKGSNDKHLLTKDFYKELRLRGYQYSGLFRGVIGCNVQGTRGRLAWVNNWVTFLDCMMQMKIITKDTRGLFMPTSIDRISIDVNIHYDKLPQIDLHSPTQSIEINVYPTLDVIRAGGVEIRGINVKQISKRIPLDVPVYEKYLFIPNFGKANMKIEDILRSNIQLILENSLIYKFKIVEIVDDLYKTNAFGPILDKIANAVDSLPLIQAEMFVYSEDIIKMPSNISVENKRLPADRSTHILIGANLLQRPEVLKNAFAALHDKGFIMSREKEPINPKDFANKYDIITIQDTGSEHVVLFRKRVPPKPSKFVKIVTADQKYAWIDKVKEELKIGQKLVLYSQGEQINGLLGLINCLRKEPGGEVFYGLLISDPSAPSFNPDLEFYEDQLDLDLAINVFQQGQWGTYRHLLLGALDTIQAHHALVNTMTIGDLSSLSWLEGPISVNSALKNRDNVLIHVYFAALNFRDVITAMGHMSIDAVASGRLAQECVQGLEVVGRTCNGNRVMGIVKNSGISNLVITDKALIWGIPDEWTLEEAASVPVAYGTVYYALVMIGQIKRGESILIHAGSGGVGQAAINVALHYGCEVFTTVSTPEKRAFIKRIFPQLKDSHIGNSRDTSFEDMVRKETNGKGVDMVLNSLAHEKLQASIRCLGYRGRFLEIGKFDISNNTPISMSFFLKEISIHGIMLDFVYDQGNEFRKSLQDLLISGIDSGAVRPLTHCTFEKNQIETAFRYMRAGKHIGKVIVKIRDEEQNVRITKPRNIYMEAVPRYMCDEELVYIVVGGLGGFGLELADWLIMRGARKVVLTSRRGVRNGYQSSRLRAWAGYEADVQISTHDVTTEEGCEQILKIANSMGTVAAIFNLAVILKDSIFENQTPQTFATSFAPKALATMNLDKLSQKYCPNLKNFVIFSSVSCGRGNAGQTNYGFSNSVMERICERRKELGLSGLAIQWGAIGDVGVVADIQDEDVQLEVEGTLQQRISSCLLSLDKLLKQDAAIVSSMVVAEKKSGGSKCENIVDPIAQIMGIKDLKKVSQKVPLAELGMDSMMAIEIKQTLEREFEIFLTAPDIRTLTFARLAEITAQKEAAASTSVAVHQTSSDDAAGLEVRLKNIGDEILVSEPFLHMPSLVSDDLKIDESSPENKLVMFMLPGLEGCAAGLAALCRRLRIKNCVLQFAHNEAKRDTLDSLVNRLYKITKSKLTPGNPYILLGYSFGTLPMLRLASLLESEGHIGIVFCLDGSPDYLYETTSSTMSINNDIQLQNDLICRTISMISPKNYINDTLMEKLIEIESYEERIDYAIKVSLSITQLQYSDKFIKQTAKASFHRIKMILGQHEFQKIKAPIVLLRTKEKPPFLVIEENYGLDKLTEGPVTVHLVEGNHANIVENKECANIINRVLAEQNLVSML
ncbi:fatty acid synthase-like [Vanessa cardui]|uniref:fatty acid synthase-like n=1 Tax=Vanessa cardui TaxID=171605 RepID=UPI001F13376A|nr:fatty acid synthase-like [Vanessa cardui]